MNESRSHFEKIPSDKESCNDPEKERRERVAEISRLVEEINKTDESLPFSGIRPEVYLKMKEDEREFSGCTTPIDKIILKKLKFLLQ